MRILPLLRIATTTAALCALASSVEAQDATGSFQSYMAQQNIVRPGMGKDPGDLQGERLRMPPALKVIGMARALNPGISCSGGDTTPYPVQACLSLCNDSRETIRFTIPAGTSLQNRSSGQLQNGVLKEPVHVVVPPKPCPLPKPRQTSLFGDLSFKSTRNVLHMFSSPAPKLDEITEDEDPSAEGFQVTLGGYCLNESMAPSEEGGQYELGPVLSDPDIRALLDLVAGRTLTEEQDQIFQTAIYSITEGRGLTPADRSALRQFRSR